MNIPKRLELPAMDQTLGTDESSDEINQLQTQHISKEIITELQDTENSCTVYRRLTRQCRSLNQVEYNDFVIQFNETTYFTSTIGEIIKNLRIVKTFLYMGGDYSQRALIFLNEGLSDSKSTERLEITQGCAHADICNVFDDYSIVTVAWPCKYAKHGNATTQALTASLLYKLVQSEEGKTYLKFTSNITNDLTKILRNKSADLESDTLESLNATLSTIYPALQHNSNMTYYNTQSVKSIKIEKKNSSMDQNPNGFENPVIIQAYRATLPNFSLKRPKIIPIYTD